ncbi:unnamed protein product, partial [Rotaria sordida]
PTTNSVSDQLALVMEQLKKMTNAIDQMSSEKTKVRLLSSSSQSNDLEQMFQNITCSNDLYMLKHFEINSQLNTITCIPCFKFKKQAPKHLLSTIKSSFGILELHIWCVEEDEKVKQELHDFIRKNKKAGFNIGRAALFCIRNGLGGLKFVHTLNLLDLCGASIGTYRHSRWFFQELRNSMATSMKQRVMEYLKSVDPVTGQQRPIGITFDKVTLLKRTLQVTMLVIMIDGQLTPIYLKSSLCKTELSGEELAANCVHDKLTGGAVDGAYIHMNINEHLCNNIGIQQNWLTISWDVAHLLELAIGDTQNQKKFNWLQMIIKTCAEVMKKYSYGKQYEFLIEAAEEIQEDILQPKQFHVTRFVSSQLRVYETILRNWKTLYILQENDDVNMALSHGDISTRTRQKLDAQQKPGDKDVDSVASRQIKSLDFVCTLIGLYDIYSILVEASLSVQQVNKYPWEYDYSIEYLQERLTKYGELLETLNFKSAQDVENLEKFDLDKLVYSTATNDFDVDEDEYDATKVQKKQSITLLEQYYHDLLKFEFQQLPITRRGGDYELEDPTKHIRQKLIELCRHLSESIAKRFEDIPEIFVLMKNCLDVAFLYQQVVLDKTQTIVDYGKSELQKLIDFTVSNSKKLINAPVIQGQYLEWKQHCLNEIQDKDMFSVWTTNGKILTSKVMKTFYTNTDLSEGINDFLHFYSLMILKIRSEAICESAASILKGHIHNNRSLQHKSLDDEVFLHWNAPPLHLADKFIEQSIDDYFINKKDKTWLFYRKSEQYQPWRLLSPGSLVLNRFRSEQVPSTKTTRIN